MTSCFRQSFWIHAGFSAAGAVAALAVFQGMPEQHAAVRILIAISAFGAFFVLGRIAAVTYASARHRRILDVLYRQLKPSAFVELYRPLSRRCRRNEIQHALTVNYLACAYAAEGDFSRAVSLLAELEFDRLRFHRLGAEVLTLNNLCRICLQSGDVDEAEKRYAALMELKDQAEVRQPALARNLGNNMRLYREHLNLLNGLPVDTDYLREEVELSGNVLYRADTELLLAQSLLGQGREAEALDILKRLEKEAEGVFAGRKAREIIKETVPD